MTSPMSDEKTAYEAIKKLKEKFGTFHYHRHEDETLLITETIPALDFIKRLTIHIPEKHFQMVRYYGIYAKHHKQENSCSNITPMKSASFLSRYLIGETPFY